MMHVKLTHKECVAMAENVAIQITHLLNPTVALNIYPVPRGGVPAAYLVVAALGEFYPSANVKLVDDPSKADVFIDDIIDSGNTMRKYLEEHNGGLFFALVDKLSNPSDDWFIFPWENTAEASIEDNILRMLQFIGEDVTREGLRETPARVAKAWKHWFRGYTMDPMDVMKTFEDGACDEMVVVRKIPFYSHCEHHIAMIIGEVSIGYIPNGRILGLSKFARLVDIFASRLQVQERLTTDIANALQKALNPKGVAVHITARHMCMESRGVQKQGHTTVTTSMLGVFREQHSTRSEFLDSIK